MKTALALGIVVAMIGSGAGFLIGKARQQANDNRPSVPAELGDHSLSLQERKEEAAQQRFTWTQLENDDLRQYIVNLRSFGCPEVTIGDIIRVRIMALYQEKINTISNPLARYWSSALEMKGVDDQIRAIRTERDHLLADLVPQSSSFDPSSALPPEKQRFVSEALLRFPKTIPSLDSTPEEQASALANRRARLSYLSQFLTPEELLDYRITQDGNAAGISSLLTGIGPSVQEFRQVFDVLDGESLNRTNGYLAPNLEAKLNAALGDARYAEYQRDAESGNGLLRSWARASRLTDDQTGQLIELRKTAPTLGAEKYREGVARIIQDRQTLERYWQNQVISWPRQK